MKITEKEYNLQTGKENITEREETTTEKNARENLEKVIAAQQAEAAINATAKTALLNKLGITAEEAALLLL